MVHGTGGIKAGGHGIFVRNFFGRTTGYNDAVDFTGGNRPQPIVHFINNVFMGSDDDLLDLDGTDAWVEGNIFMHAHRNGSPDSSSGVSGGNDSGQTSEVTVIGNIFYDCDQAANAKQGNFYTMINNTVVHQTHIGSQDLETAVVIVADDGTAEAAGVYFEGNIIYDAEKLVRNQTASIVTFTNNQMQLAWTGPGGNNSTNDPLLKYIPQLSETTGFTSWEQAQILKDWFSLRTGSPARGTGPNGLDKGGVVPIGAAISSRYGTPASAGPNVAAPNFPNGSGYTHYKFRVDGAPWSPETAIATSIALPALGNGPHFVELIGKRDSGLYQDDPLFGRDAVISSRTWTIDSSRPLLRLNEILAANSGAVVHDGKTPDVIELVNLGPAPIDLTGMRLTDDPTNPDKFLFHAGTTLDSYVVVYESDLGFGLKQDGDSLYLYDAVENGGALIDSVSFGPQLDNRSIGRSENGTWILTQPTFGGRNQAAQLGDPTRLRINEWLASGTTPFDNDFVELYNPDPLPVALGGLYLSDEIIGWPARHQIAPLSFLRGRGYLAYIADGDTTQGPEHLNFHLSADQGNIGLFLPDLTGIDCVTYPPQRLNVSQGRSPNGGSNIVFFATATPGGPNPVVSGPGPTGGALVINELLALNAGLVENGRTPDWVEIYNGTTNPIDLTDLSLSDDLLEPRRYVFPAGTTLSPAQFLRVICDPGTTNIGSLVNTNFALKSSGGAVYLFASEANFGDIIDLVTYGIQTADLSIGRVPNGTTNWTLTLPSPNAGNIAVPSMGSPLTLKVNEWMADPPSGDDDWFEIYNPNALPVAIGKLYLSDSLTDRTRYQIADLSYIGAGTNAWQQFIADDNTSAGADHVNFSLRAAGEALGISTPAGVLIDGYAFKKQDPGVSEGRFPDGSTNIIRFPGTASPGAANWRRLPEIVINEALTHTDDPLEDAIELLNLTGHPVDISGWWLSDDNSTLMKYQIPSPTFVPANGFTVIYENQFTNRELAAIPFALSSGGDEVVLSASTNGALTGYRAAVRFGNAANGVSFGRYITSDAREEFVAMTAHTFGVSDPASVQEFRTGTGATNTYPRVGPIIISEIMYHPPDVGIEDNQRDEFIELRNISSVEVKLFDPDYPTNTWHLRDAVDFDFPADTKISAGGELLVVSFDPVNNPAALAAFRATYNINPSQPIVGPYQGKLANDTDELELRRPDSAAGDDVSYILVERVRYFDTAPWPTAADGTGFSLQRISDTGFANDPSNFLASAPTPGMLSTALDFDTDGIPDEWEAAYGLDSRNPADATQDTDHDGMTNLQEYQAGTLPNDPASVLRLTIAAHVGGLQSVSSNLALTFTAQSNRSYSLLWKESVDNGTWAKLADISEAPSIREITTTDPLPTAASRIYRVVTPQEGGRFPAGPAIVSSPRSAVVNWGAEAKFGVEAYSFTAGGAITYQWSRNGAPISGATGQVLTINPARFPELGAYRVSVTDANGTVASAPVFLSVTPHIVAQPQNQSARLGTAATFGVTADGAGPLSYVWMRGRRPIPGQTNATLVITNVTAADVTNYSVRVYHQLPWGKVSTPSASATLGINTSRTLTYVVHVSLDGLGGPYLTNYLSVAPAQFPNFVRLMTEGAYTFNARCDNDVSETIPNHASILTGRPVGPPPGLPNTIHHGYSNNVPPVTDNLQNAGNLNIPYKASFFDVAHDRGLSTALYVGKVRLGICDRSYDAANGAPDPVPPDNGKDKIDVSSVPTTDLRGAIAVSNEVNLLLANLSSASPTNYSFIHIGEPDLTGHISGWGSAAWSNAVRSCDQELGRIFSVLGSNPALSGQTALIVTTDHGGAGTVHVDPYNVSNYTIPFFLWAPGIPGGVNLYSLLRNRQDPETNRVEYSDEGQPLRDGDSGNLALALLGLPAIPGSYFQPELITPLSASAFAAVPGGSGILSVRSSVGASGSGAALMLTSIETLPDNRVLLTLTIPAGQSCTILFSTKLSGYDWSEIGNYPPLPMARTVQLIAPAPPTSGFYRLRSP
ncbi:MAG TPA: lamin tail domain-containing protein [Candidatus Binatia bacterium]|nr:lamin tail domain-containing protein [Candidatus Binatia bacterium]